jgi:DNA-binding Xre family transcriptional regulator
MTDVTYFKTPSDDDMVVLPAVDCARPIDAVEMSGDVAAFDEFDRKLAAGEEELIPGEIGDRILAGGNRVRVWRAHRALSVKALVEAPGLTPAYLSQVETGKQDGTLDTYRKLAKALRVSLDVSGKLRRWPTIGAG